MTPKRPMTVADVEVRVARIQERAGDWEVTHSMSDDLWADVLWAIHTNATEDPALVAGAAWRGIQDLDFTRWYA